MRASASESRSQARNRELALERLAAKLDAGLRVQPVRTPDAADEGLAGAPGGGQAPARRDQAAAPDAPEDDD